MSAPSEDPRFTPAVDLIKRVGAATFQVGYANDEEDNDGPVVWYALAGFRWRNGRPVGNGKINRYETAAALDPVTAVLRLCDQLIDGGRCQHCDRPTGFEPTIDHMPLSDVLCWYQWDPEMKTFRRGCEGDDAV